MLAVAHSQGFGGTSVTRGDTLQTALVTLLLAGAYVLVMLVFVPRLLMPLQTGFVSSGRVTQGSMAILFLMIIASSAVTGAIGIHQVFGAFLLGAVMPKDARFVRHVSDKVEDVTVLFLLPLFFAYMGLRTELESLTTGFLWMICGLVVFTAVAGKLGGVCLAGRFCGMTWRQSLFLGSLMNTRGLMELVILNIGLSFGVLSGRLFTMMVVMALVTTFMTSPLMQLLRPLMAEDGDETGALAMTKGG